MVQIVDSDALFFCVAKAFDQTAREEYDLSYTPLVKWTAKPWKFLNGRPLGGFFRFVEPRLATLEPALTDFRILKPIAKLDELVKQTVSQSAYYVYGQAAAYLAEARNVKVL